MAHLLRGKQSGLQGDLSAGLAPELFALDQVARYGINSQIAAIAYEPVQSLLAVGTNESRFGRGQIYVFGRDRVFSVFRTSRPASVRSLQFCADRLLAVDSKNDITIFSLSLKKIESSYSPPGVPCSLTSDPTLDYAFIGLQNGEVLAYDMDRCGLAQLRIPNLWREFNPKARHVPVVGLALHPRDVGTLLIAYADGAATYSFKQNKALVFFHYELQHGAPGGFPDPASKNTIRHPRLVPGGAVWHPTGTFILTAHEDESLVVWDPKSGRMIQARTLQEVNVNRPGAAAGSFGSSPGTFALKAPITRMAWCCKRNPDDTGILIAGGAPTNVADRGLTFFELGPTPTFQTSSWQILSEHFERPKGQHTLASPPHADVVDFCLIPRESPHFAGAQDPIAVLAILGSGEMVSLSFPSGHPITPTNQLHPSLTFVHPFVSRIAVSYIERTRWLGMTEKRSQGPPFLRGGASAAKPLMRFASRNIIQTAHVDGTIRIWDGGHGDEIENGGLLQVDIARVLGRSADVQVSHMSMSGATGELAAGTVSGEVIILRWDRNRFFGQSAPPSGAEPLGLKSIKETAEPDLKEGLVPFTLFRGKGFRVTSVCQSDIGFTVFGFEDGNVSIVDLRGPAVILEANLMGYAKPGKRLSVRRSASNQTSKSEWPSAIEFAVMSLEGDDYSSILVFVGSNLGRLVTFKLLPQSNGAFQAHLAGTTSVEDRVVSIFPLNSDSGASAGASQNAVASLREGNKVNGVVLVVTSTGARIFKPASAKGATKAWGDTFCYSAAVARKDDRSAGLVCLFGDGTVRTFSLPGLREISSVRVDEELDMQRLSETIITPTGDIFGWAGPSEIVALNPWGSGTDLTTSKDKLINPDALIPPRPTISNVQWISGTQHFTASDLDVLVGGPDRPPSKKMMEQMRAEEQQRRTTERGAASSSLNAPPSSHQDEGYWAYMQRQIQERTGNLNIMGDSMDKLEESSSNWADDVNKFVSNQKKKAVMGMIGSKFGF